MRLTVVVIALLLGAGVAHAYPQFQLVHDTACGTCHLSPAGGGLLTAFGRDEAGSTISRGGDGRLLHGLWDSPEWLAVGGDFRFAFAGKRNEPRSDVLIFPMQTDVNLRVMKGDFAFAFTAGLRGVARNEEDEQPTFIETLVSREHYVAYAFDEQQVRVGRFFPVFGLRLHDHTAYVRRFMGLNTFEEPYAVELAHYGETTTTHVTAFVPQPIDVLGSGVRRSGGVVHVEHATSDSMIVGGQARAGVSDRDGVFTVGAIGKRYFADAGILVLGELDLQRQTFYRRAPGRSQIAGYLGASKWLTRGVMVSSAVHVWEPDLTLRGTTRQAFEIGAQYFPWAHVELHLLLRASAQGTLAEDPGFLSLLQVHYFL